MKLQINFTNCNELIRVSVGEALVYTDRGRKFKFFKTFDIFY